MGIFQKSYDAYLQLHTHTYPHRHTFAHAVFKQISHCLKTEAEITLFKNK